MITVKVTYDDGDYTVKGFNGTLDEAVRYFLGSTFNLGTERDDMHRCVKVELLGDEPTKAQQGYRLVQFTRYGQVVVPANSDEEALEAIKLIDPKSINWEPVKADVLESAEVLGVVDENGSIIS